MARQSLLSVVLGLKSDKFEKGLTSAQRKIDATSRKLSSVGRGLSIGLTAPLVAVGASSFKVAADFELAMKKVKAISGATGGEFKALSQNAKDLGASTVFSATAVSSLQLEMAKLGLSSDEIIKATDNTLALAQAFGNELGPTAETVVKTINQFGLEAEDAGHVADVLATSFAKSGLDLEKFSGAMANAAPVAKTFGFSLEETTALLGVLANNGIEGTDAGTKLKMAFSELAAQGVDVKDTFTALINGSLDYKTAVDILGKRAAILTPIFGENLEALDDLQKELQNTEGRAKAMASEMDDSAKGGIASMKSAIEGAQIELGTALAPTVLAVVDRIKTLAQGFSDLNPSTQRSIVKFGLFAAALGPVTSAIGGLIRGVRDSVKALKKAALFLTTNPYGILITGAALVIGAMMAMKEESFEANKTLLTFNETIEAQNDLLDESVKALAARAALVREAFRTDDENETIAGLNKQLSALRGELDRISPDSFQKFVDKALELANDPLQSLELGLLPVIDPNTRQFSQAAADLNKQIIAGATGVDFSPAILDIIAGLDPFEVKDMTSDEQFDAVQKILLDRVGEIESSLEEKNEAIKTNVEVVVDITGGGTKTPEKTLAEITDGLKKQLEDIRELEVLFGQNFDEDKFKAIESAIREIVEADFKDADDTLTSLTEQMSQYAEQVDAAATPLSTLQETIKSLETSRGLGIVSDLELAQKALEALQTTLVESILADPNFIKTEQFEVLNAKMLEFQALLKENKVEQDETNAALFEAADAGQLVADLVGAGFDSATNSATSFKDAVTGIFISLIKRALSTAIANAITAAFSPASPDNIITGGAAAPIKATALKASVASLFASIPKLHDGGMTLGPQLALIGDNPSGREAVIPMEKMGSFLGQVAGTNQNMNVTGRIHGSDILLSQERAKRNRGR